MGALVAVLVATAPATVEAEIPDSFVTPAACAEFDLEPGGGFIRCDDGVPSNSPLPGPGGTIPNRGGVSAVTVPAAYGRDGYSGLPPEAADAASFPGADADGNIALDVEVHFPSTRTAGEHPLLFFMHGCCGGNKHGWESADYQAGGREAWHYNTAWFASRGYVVVNYTSRGFVNGSQAGSTGEMHLQSRRYEINDYQHLACQVTDLFNSKGRLPDVDPQRVVTTGGSYGGGFSWMSITDPRWRCTPDTGSRVKMRLAVSAPKYAWTDLAYTLAPTGTHMQTPDELPATDGCDTGPVSFDGAPCPAPRTPVGTVKRSILSGLYLTGNLLTGGHTTFPMEMHEGVVCMMGAYPVESNPSCAATVNEFLPTLLADSSAYYQSEFFRRIKRPGYRVPIFDAATFGDPLFPSVENRRMINRLLSVAPGYPIQAYFGDYQHFTKNKPKIWADVCGADRHICTDEDYTRGFNQDPPTLRKLGVTTMLNRFLDHYARPPANPQGPRPDFDVTAETQVCPQTAPAGQPLDESGPRYSAPTFEQLAPRRLRFDLVGEQTVNSLVLPNSHALYSDPLVNEVSNRNGCISAPDPAGAGVAVYTSEPLERRQTMLGAATVTAGFAPTSGSGLQLNARLYDVLPDGRGVLVDRGTRVIAPEEASAGRVRYQMHGNGWRFEPGHSVRIELAADYEPFIHLTESPFTLALSGVRLSLPVRRLPR